MRRRRTSGELQTWETSQLALVGRTAGARLRYYPSLVTAYVRQAVNGRKTVRFMGRDFVYDSVLSPVLLLQYPHEVSTELLANTNEPIESILDIGANIGQFSATACALLPDIERLDAFEPNRQIFELLEANLSCCRNATCYNHGIGPAGTAGTAELFFTPGFSGVGSLMADNADYRSSDELTSIDVDLISDVASTTQCSHYDLVKIDVEGYEYEVIEAIENISMRYLFIEMTGPVKDKSHRSSELLVLLRDKLGPYELIFHSESHSQSSVYMALLEF